jgi:hypothetical protein
MTTKLHMYIPNNHEVTYVYNKWPQNYLHIYQMTTKLPNSLKIYQTAVKYSNIFHSKALQNMHKWDFGFENIPSGNICLLSRSSTEPGSFDSVGTLILTLLDNWKQVFFSRFLYWGNCRTFHLFIWQGLYHSQSSYSELDYWKVKQSYVRTKRCYSICLSVWFELTIEKLLH